MRMSVEAPTPDSPHPYLLTYLSAHLSLDLRTYPLHMGETIGPMGMDRHVSRHEGGNTLQRGQRFYGVKGFRPIIVIIA